MEPEYFDLQDDVNHPNRWWLGRLTNARGERVDERDFTERTSAVPDARSSGLRFSIKRTGEPLDFTIGAFLVPVLRRSLALIIAGLAGDDVDVVPVTITGAPGEYAILHVLRNVDALDLQRTRHTVYTDEETRDGLKHMRGKPKHLDRDFVLRAAPIGDARVFRVIDEWVSIVVARPIYEAMMRQGRVTGVTFRPVKITPAS